MYKLTVVQGPRRGTSYTVREGETSIGRQSDNEIVIASSRISKRHCVLVVSNGEAVVTDQGSANGTYVNGVLTKSKKLQEGDRISVGNVVLELRTPVQRSLDQAPQAALGLPSNVIPFPGGAVSPVDSASGFSTPLPGDIMPQDLRGRVSWSFEKFVMPFFYNLTLRYQWRSVLATFVLGFVAVALLATIQPMIDSAQQSILAELKRKAQLIARQLVDLNQGQLQIGAGDTKARAGTFEQEDGVRFAVVTDLELRVLAPDVKANRHLAAGDEARLAVTAARLYRQGSTGGIVRVVGGDTVVAIEPLWAFDPKAGKNSVVAMAVTALDASISRPEWGQIGLIYSQSMLILGFAAIVLFLVFYRLTLKPLEILNDDIDRVLKGEQGQVTREFKWDELSALFDVVNSALQRIPIGRGTGAGASGESESSVQLSDFYGLFSALGTNSKSGLVVFNSDRKVIFMNSVFEELSGIHAEQARGEDIRNLARDQALGAMVNDLFDRAHTSSQERSSIEGGDGVGIQEDFDFSGISYKMTALFFGAGNARGFVLVAAKVDRDS